MGSKQSRPQRRDDGLSLYLHAASRERLSMLAKVLGASKKAVIIQAISRWVLQASKSREPRWVWYVESPFYGVPKKRRVGDTVKVCARVPAEICQQVEALADTLHVSLSAVVEQALLRWYWEDPLVKQQNGQSEQAEV